MQAARRLLEPGQEILVHKKTPTARALYGTHENYLVDRALPFAVLVRTMLPWFVSRQVFTGRARSAARTAPPRSTTRSARGRLLRGGGRPRDDAEASDREHA